MKTNLKFDLNNQAIVNRKNIKNTFIDISGRDLILGFNEASFKKSNKKLNTPDLDSKLNARLISYFLPAIEIAKMQKKRPRLFVISGLNISLKWNSNNEKERKIMMINNNIKIDFIKTFIEKFYPNVFSIVEFIVAQDPIKIPEGKLLKLWEVIEKIYPLKVKKIKIALARFKNPKLFNSESLNKEAENILSFGNDDLINSFKYTISHLFALGDINFEGNYIHNKIGYLSIGGHQEIFFNEIRNLSIDIVKKIGEDIFERKLIIKNNLKLIIKTESNSTPPYNGSFKKTGRNKLELEEVTYENGRGLIFYNKNKKLKYDMNYIYENFISQNEYEKFWNNYKKKYFNLYNRYKEAFNLK